MTRRTLGLAVTLALAGSLFAPVPGRAQGVQAFLKIDGIPGESTDVDHKDWIDLDGFGEGVSVQAVIGGAAGGGGTGKADFQPLKVIKRIDKASPLLFLNAAQGKHLAMVTLQLTRTGSKGLPLVFFEVKLQDALISSISLGGGDGGAQPKELVSFVYGRIDWTYRYVGADGQTGEVTGGWDLKTNSKV
jgi:type VI secretion system secreted protein Hcp